MTNFTGLLNFPAHSAGHLSSGVRTQVSVSPRRDCTYACSASHCEDVCPSIEPCASTALDASSAAGDEDNSLKVAVSL